MVRTKLPASVRADERNKKNVDAYLAGDKSAVGRLYEDNYVYVKTVLTIKLRNKADVAEDLAQDVMIKMINNLGSFKNTETLFRSWLASIINSVFIDYTRKMKHAVIVEGLETMESSGENDSDNFENVAYNKSIEFGGSYDNVLKDIYAEERKAALMTAINGLNNVVYKRIMRKLLDGKSYEEIAVETGEAMGTVKSIIFRVKEELKKNSELRETVFA